VVEAGAEAEEGAALGAAVLQQAEALCGLFPEQVVQYYRPISAAH
jgi:hypothetical protein